MFEILLGLMLGYSLWRVVLALWTVQGLRARAVAQEGGGTAPVLSIRKMLNVEGTHAVGGPLDFLRGYNVPVEQVLDIRCFCAEQEAQPLPERVHACLQRAYAEGLARGVDAAQVAQGRRPLRKGERVYFALVRTPDAAEHIVSFIGSAP
jgi:hypothetical protein